MKLVFTFLFLSICGLSASQAPLSLAQSSANSAFTGKQLGNIYKSIVLQSKAEKLLANENMSEDLKLRISDALANAEQRFIGCASQAIVPGLQFRCAALQLAAVKQELNIIESELAARSEMISSPAESENIVIGSNIN